MHNGRYCLVKSIQEEKTILLSDKGKEENLPTKQFIAAWKGVVLIIDETQASYHEPYYQLKQILYLAKKYRCLSTIGLAGIIYLLASPRQTGDLLFNTLTWIGLAVSILIIYKESYNKDFLQRFCKIGNIVDCNEIFTPKPPASMESSHWEKWPYYITQHCSFLRHSISPSITASGLGAPAFPLHSPCGPSVIR